MSPAPRNLYGWIRDLHLYLGLFLSPFVLVFALSTVVLNHPGLLAGAAGRRAAGTEVTRAVKVPAGLEQLEGMERIQKVRRILRQAGVAGEVGFIRFLPNEQRMIIPVMKPGEEITLDLNLRTRHVTIARHATGLRDALVYLHKSPGPHLVNIRGNWPYTVAWRWLADATVVSLLFLSLSGVYLWAVLKAERKIGLVLLGAGAASFVLVLYALTA